MFRFTRVGSITQPGQSLIALDISKQSLNDSHFVQLANVLKVNKLLKILIASRNECGDEGACALASLLSSNITLQHLHLNHNKIKTHGATALAKSLRFNTTLVSLDLCSNSGVRSTGASKFIAVLRRNNSLHGLGLGSCGIEEQTTADLLTSLHDNLRLTDFRLEGNSIDQTQSLMIALILQRNLRNKEAHDLVERYVRFKVNGYKLSFFLLWHTVDYIAWFYFYYTDVKGSVVGTDYYTEVFTLVLMVITAAFIAFSFVHQYLIQQTAYRVGLGTPRKRVRLARGLCELEVLVLKEKLRRTESQHEMVFALFQDMPQMVLFWCVYLERGVFNASMFFALVCAGIGLVLCAYKYLLTVAQDDHRSQFAQVMASELKLNDEMKQRSVKPNSEWHNTRVHKSHRVSSSKNLQMVPVANPASADGLSKRTNSSSGDVLPTSPSGSKRFSSYRSAGGRSRTTSLDEPEPERVKRGYGLITSEDMYIDMDLLFDMENTVFTLILIIRKNLKVAWVWIQWLIIETVTCFHACGLVRVISEEEQMQMQQETQAGLINDNPITASAAENTAEDDAAEDDAAEDDVESISHYEDQANALPGDWRTGVSLDKGGEEVVIDTTTEAQSNPYSKQNYYGTHGREGREQPTEDPGQLGTYKPKNATV